MNQFDTFCYLVYSPSSVRQLVQKCRYCAVVRFLLRSAIRAKHMQMASIFSSVFNDKILFTKHESEVLFLALKSSILEGHINTKALCYNLARVDKNFTQLYFVPFILVPEGEIKIT